MGLGEVVSVASDSGMMGGDLSHDFMLLTPIGEDSIAICKDCDYRSNTDVAESVIHNTIDNISNVLALKFTPNLKNHL